MAIAIENARLFSEVQELAITDPVTGLNNRRRLFELGEQEFNRSKRYERPLSAIMLDLDHLKTVNDSFGHSVGDQVLIQFAENCRNGIRHVDVLCRYGGEEFVILLPETDLEEAYTIAERLREYTEHTPVESSVGLLPITVSVGVAALDETCGTLQELIDRADFAQYASKDNGRNRTTRWTLDIPPRKKDTGSLYSHEEYSSK
jgi:diguanylate cyclase (GGDEF)-like protein